ncbi:MAG: hypothetical protein AAFO83_02295 [Cyanobacteria bacterium J06607_13]
MAKRDKKKRAKTKQAPTQQDKTVKTKSLPKTKKEPKTALEPTSFNHKRPAWRVSHLEMVDPYGWHETDAVTLKRIREKLGDFESMTWNQILVDGKKRHHSIRIDQIAKPALKRLREIEQDDIDRLVSLSLSGKQRVWGILEEGVLRLLWWDPNHKICPSHKKHT